MFTSTFLEVLYILVFYYILISIFYTVLFEFFSMQSRTSVAWFLLYPSKPSYFYLIPVSILRLSELGAHNLLESVHRKLSGNLKACFDDSEFVQYTVDNCK